MDDERRHNRVFQGEPADKILVQRILNSLQCDPEGLTMKEIFRNVGNGHDILEVSGAIWGDLMNADLVEFTKDHRFKLTKPAND